MIPWFAWAYLVLGLPGLFLTSALFFMLATITRSMMATYIGVVAVLIAYLASTGVLGSRPEFETAIFEDLAWLGLDWEMPVRRQSDHLADFAAVVDVGHRAECLGVLVPRRSTPPMRGPTKYWARKTREPACAKRAPRSKAMLSCAPWVPGASGVMTRQPAGARAGSRRHDRRRGGGGGRAGDRGPAASAGGGPGTPARA